MEPQQFQIFKIWIHRHWYISDTSLLHLCYDAILTIHHSRSQIPNIMWPLVSVILSFLLLLLLLFLFTFIFLLLLSGRGGEWLGEKNVKRRNKEAPHSSGNTDPGERDSAANCIVDISFEIVIYDIWDKEMSESKKNHKIWNTWYKACDIK